MEDGPLSLQLLPTCMPVQPFPPRMAIQWEGGSCRLCGGARGARL